jgi:hypothetical protein
LPLCITQVPYAATRLRLFHLSAFESKLSTRPNKDYFGASRLVIHCRFALPKCLTPLRGYGFFICPLLKASFQRVQIKKPRTRAGHLLPDQDSNPNIQSQNLSYYHYTIRQSQECVLNLPGRIKFRGAKILFFSRRPGQTAAFFSSCCNILTPSVAGRSITVKPGKGLT